MSLRQRTGSNIKMSIFALVVSLLLLAGIASSAERPNILWIIAEDMGPELGCYGHPEVWTPELDNLAARGVRYTQAFTVTPVCSTSRSSFMTGMYAHSIGAHNHRCHRSGHHGYTVLRHRKLSLHPQSSRCSYWFRHTHGGFRKYLHRWRR